MSTSRDLLLWDGDTARAVNWTGYAGQGSSATLASESGGQGSALRFAFELGGHAGWAVARCKLDVTLPAHYVVSARVRGEGPPLDLQVKLVDAAGASVWWWRRRGLTFSAAHAQRLVLRRASLELAWGPALGAPDRIGAVEIAVAGDHDVRGTLWIEDVRIEPREPAGGVPVACAIRASTAVAGHGPECTLDGDPTTGWRPDPDDERPWLEVDLGSVREWGGLAVDFAAPAVPATRLLASDDRTHWTLLAETPPGGDVRRWLGRGEVESRYARLELGRGDADVARVAVVSIELATSRPRFASAMAKAAPRGRFPRHLLDEQGYWAVVGGDGDTRKALLGEDGALEVDAEAFTLEPFLRIGGRLLAWADVERRAWLADDYLPIPSVEWSAEGVRLCITAFVAGEPGASTVVVRYEVEDGGDPAAASAVATIDSAGDARRCHTDAQLLVAVRPFQVTPAWQGLNLSGGVAPIVRLARVGAHLRVNDTRDVIAVRAPDAFASSTFADGIPAMFDRDLPGADDVVDPLGFAHAVFAFDLDRAPGARAVVTVAVPLFPESPPPPRGLAAKEADEWSAALLAETVAYWRARLAHVPITLPPCAAAIAASMRASIAWILVNREGPRIQPGPRAYRRSWIRDGTLTATALAEMGFADEARAFLRWYAPYQLPDGRVPCAVDRRGIDHAVEHDSHGQLVWGIVETFRLTRDLDFLRALWPHVLRAVDAIARLRAERTVEADRARCRYGLLPESISHEGYAASPVHAYWDDFFAVRALADAADAARVLGDHEGMRIAALRDAMRGDLRDSIVCTMVRQHLTFVPGSVELGDFDPTSTAIAFDPCRVAPCLPREAVERTFGRYWEEHAARQRGETPGDGYTPYEMRNVVALLRLAWKERALALLAWLVDDQRPCAWRQWPEVARRDRRTPGFLGDLPHGWVASTFLRTVRRLLVDEGDDGTTLVLCAGVPEAWVREPPGIRVCGLATLYGTLSFTVCVEDDCVRFTFGARPAPPGGIVVESPLARTLRDAVIDGQVRPADDARRIRLRELPAELVFRY